MFFADFWSFCDYSHKNEHQFQELFYLLFLDDHMVQGTSKYHKVEKYIFHCFGDECCPKWDFEKLTTALCQSCGASLYIL